MTDENQNTPVAPKTPHEAAAAAAAVIAVFGLLGYPHALGFDVDTLTTLLAAAFAFVSTVYAVLTRRAAPPKGDEG